MEAPNFGNPAHILISITMMTLIIVYSNSESNQFTLKIKSYCRSRDADRPTMTSHRRSWHAWHPRIDAPRIDVFRVTDDE